MTMRECHFAVYHGLALNTKTREVAGVNSGQTFFYPNFMIYGLCSLLHCYQLTVTHIQGSSLYYAVVSETIHSCIFLAYQVWIHTNGSTI